MTQPRTDPHDVLGVPRDATREVIRQAHRELSAYYASGHAGDDAARRLSEVNEAYELLTSPTRRGSSDRSARGARPGPGEREPFAMRMPERREEQFRFELAGENAQHRRTLQRMLLMYGPLTLASLALLMVPVSSLLDGTVGAVIPLTIIGVVVLAVAFQALTALRDLRAEPLFTRGEVQRSWSKGGLLWFFRSHFLMINRQVFVVTPETWVRVGEGEMVECHHWPHTRTVIRVLILHGSEEQLAALDRSRPIVPL